MSVKARFPSHAHGRAVVGDPEFVDWKAEPVKNVVGRTMDVPKKPGNHLIGRQVGNYEVIALLGRGGMGEVYLARHPVLGREVAVKVLGGAVCREEVLVKRFRQEARAACRIGHPAIVEVADFGTLDDGRSYYIMERLRGNNLRQYMLSRGPLSVAEVQFIITPVMEALAAAHLAGIVHRDIKPDNIFLAAQPDGTFSPKILDFGVAKLLDVGGDGDAAMTRTGALIGTPLYMSPEQASGAGRKVGPWSDIYSVGAVLFHMFTGNPPFQGGSFGEVLVQHLQAPPPSVFQVRPDLPIGLDEVIRRSMAKDPASRQPSMEAMLGEFVAAVAGRTCPASVPPSVPLSGRTPDAPQPCTGPEAYAPTVTPPFEASSAEPSTSAPAFVPPVPDAGAVPPVPGVGPVSSVPVVPGPVVAARTGPHGGLEAPVSTAQVGRRRPGSGMGLFLVALGGLLAGGSAVAVLFVYMSKSKRRGRTAGKQAATVRWDAGVRRSAQPEPDGAALGPDAAEASAGALRPDATVRVRRAGPVRRGPRVTRKGDKTRDAGRFGSDTPTSRRPRMTKLSLKIKGGLSRDYLERAVKEMRAGRYQSAFSFARASFRVLPNARAAVVAARAACLGRLPAKARWAHGRLEGARRRRVAAFCLRQGIDLR